MVGGGEWHCMAQGGGRGGKQPDAAQARGGWVHSQVWSGEVMSSGEVAVALLSPRPGPAHVSQQRGVVALHPCQPLYTPWDLSKYPQGVCVPLVDTPYSNIIVSNIWLALTFNSSAVPAALHFFKLLYCSISSDLHRRNILTNTPKVMFSNHSRKIFHNHFLIKPQNTL